MKRWTVVLAEVLAGVAAIVGLPAPAIAATAEEQAVLAPLQALFDGMAKRDKAAINAVLLPDGGATLIRNGKIIQFRLGTFADRMPASTTPIEERIHDPLIRIDDDIAMIWAPYEFLVDGQVDHCGTDVVNLVRRDGKWMIAGIADNSRKDCGPQP